jgi:hypothetical protein
VTAQVEATLEAVAAMPEEVVRTWHCRSSHWLEDLDAIKPRIKHVMFVNPSW